MSDLAFRSTTRYVMSSQHYIKDGLVHMWDAIENAGVGLPHDNSATLWKDLIGNYDMQLAAKFAHFEKNSLFIDNSAYPYESLMESGRTSNYHTLTFKVLNVTAETPCVKLGRCRNIYFLNGGYACYVYDDTRPDYCYDCVLHQHDVVSMTMSDKLFINGKEMHQNSMPAYHLSGVNDSQRFFVGMSAQVYSIREYNRPLTAKEVAFNYKVDKERFGI